MWFIKGLKRANRHILWPEKDKKPFWLVGLFIIKKIVHSKVCERGYHFVNKMYKKGRAVNKDW